MAPTVNYHPLFHWLPYSICYMVTTLTYYIIFYMVLVPVFQLAVLACTPQVNMASITNLKSALEFREVIDHKLSKELQLEGVLVPFAVPPASCNYRVSPLGVVPKKAAGVFQMIQHLSYPEGSSVNDFSPHKFSSVRYATIPRPLTLLSISLNWFTWLRSILNPLFGSFLFHQQRFPVEGPVFHGRRSAYGLFQFMCYFRVFQYSIVLGC